MHPVVLDVLAVEAAFITEILFKLLVYIVSDGLPALGVVHCIPKAGRVHDGELQLDSLLLDVNSVFQDLYCLVDAFLSTQQFPVLVQVSQEETVDKGRLPQAGLTGYHECEVETLLD